MGVNLSRYRNLGQIPVPAAPVISLTDEQRILQATLPPPSVQVNFLSQNTTPIVLGVVILFLGIIGMLSMVKV